MKRQKILQVLKDGAEYFSTTAGAVSLIIGIITISVAIPPFVSIPLIFGVGAIFGYFGARRRWKQLAEEQAIADAAQLEQQESMKEKNQMLEIGRSLNQKMTDIVEAEHKVQMQLKEYRVEQKLEHAHKRTKSEHSEKELALAGSHTAGGGHHGHARKPGHRRSVSVHDGEQLAKPPKLVIKISNMSRFFPSSKDVKKDVKKASHHLAALPPLNSQDAAHPLPTNSISLHA